MDLFEAIGIKYVHAKPCNTGLPVYISVWKRHIT